MVRYFSEINHYIHNNTHIGSNGDLSNSSNSRNVEQENNCNDINAPLFLNEKTWKYDVMQDPNQFDNAYSKIKKEKRKINNKIVEVIKIKTEKLNLNKYKELKNPHCEPTQAYTEGDFNEDLDEFSEVKADKKIIGSINMKFNDINVIDNKNKGQYSYKKQLCITEPDNFIDTTANMKLHGMHTRNLSSTLLPAGGNKYYNNYINYNFSNLTPNNNKGIPYTTYNLTPRNLNFHPQNNFGLMKNNIIYNNNPNQINPPNFNNVVMTKTTGSFVSQSNYSSCNKARDGAYEHNEESTEGDYSHEE